MKILNLALASIFILPIACSDRETKVDGPSATVSDGKANVTDERGKTIQMQEDENYETLEGDKIEYDKDPIGDDQIEVNE